ncbi:carbohydrate binding domain-containing protein [Streptomyces sp. NPDC060064]|uniref:carbohydrate binding domain-containing protein n=1 Tax=Streptomyces sp. NPDC060064 TaxID=3347049 RepID=UPI003681356C
MTRLVVEVGFGSTLSTPPASITWTDITQYVDIDSAAVTINRGAQDEQSETQMGSASLTLDNSDGRFTAGLASGAYSPNVLKNVPCRIRVISTAKNLLPNPSFESGVTAWISSGTPTRATSTTHVQHGAQAMLITWGAVASQTMTSPLIQGLNIGTRYTFSAYVWVPTGDAPVRLTVADVTTGAQNTVFDAFQRLTVSWTATSTTHQVRVGAIGTPVAGDVVWVDAGQIEEASSATTFDSDGPQDHERIYGGVNAWPTTWKGLYSTASITISDTFKPLAKPSLQTMLTEEVLLDDPLGYYPLTEPSDSTSAGDLSGTTAGPLSTVAVGSGGELAFAASDAGPDEQGALTLTPATISNGKFLTGDLGGDFENSSTLAFVFAECWFSTATVSRVIFGLTSADNRYQLVFSLSAGGLLTIESTNTGAALTSSSPVTGNLADGAQHHMVYDEEAATVWVDGVDYAVGVDIMSHLRLLTVGAFTNSRLWSGSISHLALYAPGPSGDITQYVGHYTTGTTGHVGETAATRASRIASYVGATVTAVGSTFSGIASQAALGSSPLQHLQEVAQTEGGVLIAARDSAGLILQSRDLRYNPTAAISIAHPDTETDSVAFDDDDQKLCNIVIGSRPGGATQRVINQASRDTYGPYEKQLTLLKTTDAELVDAAQWTVNRFADPPPEMRQLPLEAYTLPLATYRALLDADVSTVFGVTGLPAQAPASTTTVTVEGYTETIKNKQHLINFRVSRTDTATVWVLNDSTYSVLGTSTRLAY